MNNYLLICGLLMGLCACSDVESDIESATYLLNLPTVETPCAPQSLPSAFPVCTSVRYLSPPHGWFTARVNGELVVGSANVIFWDSTRSNQLSNDRFRLTLRTHLAGPCYNTSTLVVENLQSVRIGEMQPAPQYGLSVDYIEDYRDGIVSEAAADFAYEDYDVAFASYQPDTNKKYEPIFIIDCINEIDTLVNGRGAGRFVLVPETPDFVTSFPDTLIIDSIIYQAQYFN